MNKKRLVYTSVLLVLLCMSILCGCGKEKKKESSMVSVSSMGEEKFIVVRYTAEENIQENAAAVLTHIESGNVQEARYVPEMRSFCFVVEENGMYEIQVTNGATVISPRYLQVTKNTNQYVVCIVAVD